MAYIDKHGVEYTDDKKILVCCPQDFEGEYIIPDGVTTIDNEAFAYCRGLTSVTIPNSVTIIGREAFRDCSQLQEVSFVGGSIYIEVETFQDCPCLNSIDISSNLHLNKGHYTADEFYKPFRHIININYNGDNEYAPWGALALNGYKEGPLYFKDESKKILLGCEKNYEGEIVIPESVVEIGESAFAYCTQITDIILHENIIKIGYDALPQKRKVSWNKTVNCIWYIPYGTYAKFMEMYGQNSYNYEELDMYGQKFDSIGGLKEGKVPSYKEVYENGITSFIFPEDTRRIFTDGEGQKIYFTGELQSLTLLDEASKYHNRVFYINNYIEDVDVNYVRKVDNSLVKYENLNKRYDNHLIFKAPLPNTKPAIGKVVELTYCGQSLNYRYTEYVWSTPIAINVDDIACIVETRLRCYEGMHSGCRIMLLGGKSDQLAKQELPCYVDVWEDYDFVLQKLLQAGWMR